MARKAADVYRDALALSEEEREELLRLLTMQADDGWGSPEIKQAWMEEIARREKLYAEGKMKTIPAEQVFAEARRLLDE
ncbi:MAG: addiction module protein [Gammaproteobacteria bacterium]|nr:addiction module protein [Gammaproteobacteria bacterium]